MDRQCLWIRISILAYYFVFHKSVFIHLAVQKQINPEANNGGVGQVILKYLHVISDL